MSRPYTPTRFACACVLMLCVMIAACYQGRATPTPAPTRDAGAFRPPTAIPTPLIIPPAGTHVGPASLYPDPAKTPGATFPVTAADVCTSGYSSGVRNVTTEEKKQVYAEYGLLDANGNWPSGKYEVDHFTSLELAGSNDITNLWPEPYVTPDAPGQIGAHQKDAVENQLHAQVCAHLITLQQAQDAIRNDWYAVYLQMQHAGAVTLPATDVP